DPRPGRAVHGRGSRLRLHRRNHHRRRHSVRCSILAAAGLARSGGCPPGRAFADRDGDHGASQPGSRRRHLVHPGDRGAAAARLATSRPALLVGDPGSRRAQHHRGIHPTCRVNGGSWLRIRTEDGRKTHSHAAIRLALGRCVGSSSRAVRDLPHNRLGSGLAPVPDARGAGHRSSAARRLRAALRTSVAMAIGSLANLTYWYPGSREPALSDVSTLLDDGLTVIAGPSGGGKSTLLRVLNGLVPHFHGGRIAGGARVLGLDVIRTPTRDLARSVGFVFQDPELQTVYSTVDREVAFGLENIGVATRMIAGRVEEALQAAGIGHLVGRTVRTLSGGERQRVALASSIAMRPQLVVLDEPTSQLDPDGAALVLAPATRLVDEGLAVIISEHRLDRLLKAAAGLVLVGGGRVERADPAIWRPPSAAGPSRRMSAPGSETWSLEGATAGFNGQPVVEDVN